MPVKLPLFWSDPLLEFIEKSVLEEGRNAIKEFFEEGSAGKLRSFIDAEKTKWMTKLNGLWQERAETLFNAEPEAVPNLDEKIRVLASQNNRLAKEILELREIVKEIGANKLPKEVTQLKDLYLQAKSIATEGRELKEEMQRQMDWCIDQVLLRICYPDQIFAKKAFAYELDYKEFVSSSPIRFAADAFTLRELYTYYRIWKDKPKLFLDIKDIVKRRYEVSPVLGGGIMRLLWDFLHGGNDEDRCNRFFTRRMRLDISEAKDRLRTWMNHIGDDSEEQVFHGFFLASPKAKCNLHAPLEKPIIPLPGLIEQAFYNHLIGNYAAATNLLIPIAEGIIWDISVAEHLANGGIYDTQSRLDNHNVNQRVLLDEDGNQINLKPNGEIRWPTLRDLLERTRMKQILSAEFIKTFCGELYSQERNPILHGARLDYNNSWNSSRLLLVLEYLAKVIKDRGYKYPLQLDPPGLDKTNYGEDKDC